MIARIRDRATFQALGRARRRRFGPLTLRYMPGCGRGAPRVAFAVGRAAGNAVVRNRIRRRLRAAARETGELEPGGAYLFGADAEAATMSFSMLRAAVTRLVADAGRSEGAP